MFTGIIEEVGIIKEITVTKAGGSLRIGAHLVTEETKIGDSIAVNGACLTVTAIAADSIFVDVMPETIRCTTTESLRAGSRVNLERAMAATDRFGGHVVTGHVSGVAAIRRRYREGTAVWLGLSSTMGAPVVQKGSIAIDGVSLTISRISRGLIWVSLIPHTRDATTLGQKRIGDRCNIEHDIMASYAAQPSRTPHLGMDQLRDSGF